jgi:hypothetical protein
VTVLESSILTIVLSNFPFTFLRGAVPERFEVIGNINSPILKSKIRLDENKKRNHVEITDLLDGFLFG